VVDYVGISFAARVVGGAERPCQDEVDRLGWFAEAEALALPIAPHTRVLVTEAFHDAPEAAFAAPEPHPAG
jgi:hypothetical protein